jgi:hypothetical protein
LPITWTLEEAVTHRIHLLATAVIVAGAAALAQPRPAAATYLNPLDPPSSGSGISYCCYTGTDTHCCFLSGCYTREGVCLRIP